MEYIGIRISVAIFIALFWIIYKYFVDILMYLTKKSFQDVTTYQFHFTRNDQPQKADALHMRIVNRSVLLRSIVRNLFLYYVVIICAYRSSEESPVLSFGKYTESIQRFIRKFVVPIWSNSQIKRDSGKFNFIERKMQVCVIYDREDSKIHTIKIVLISDEDLQDFQKYIDKPPKTAENFNSLCLIHRAYQKTREIFLRFNKLLHSQLW